MPDLVLDGVPSKPLAGYLKALGILRLVAEQEDTSVRGAWCDGRFVLGSRLDAEALVRFFASSYRPTPLFSPWNKEGGFASDKVDVERVAASDAERWEGLKVAHAAVRRAFEELKTQLAPDADAKSFIEKHKDELRSRLRQVLPDEALSWLDVCFVPVETGWSSFRLLGTGGLDARAEFSPMFLKALNEVVPALRKQATVQQQRCSVAAAELSLFGRIAGERAGDRGLLKKSTMGQFAPGASGGPNLNTGFGGDTSRLSNPWDLVLALEGSLLIRPAATAHLDATRQRVAAFPFQVEAVKGLGGATVEKDDIPAELWMPLWERQASLREVARLFREGRARVGRRAANSAVDLVRAAVTRGVDRGVTSFERYAFRVRKGGAQATPLVRVDVRSGFTEERFLRELDPWMGAWRRATADPDKTPARFSQHRRRMEQALFEAARLGGRTRVSQLLEEIGASQRALCRAPKFRETEEGHERIPPLRRLSSAWIDVAHDGSAEFEIAWAIAGLGSGGEGVPVRSNLEPVTHDGRSWRWIKGGSKPGFVGRGCDVLVDLLLDRGVAEHRAAKELGGTSGASAVFSSRHGLEPAAILAFLEGAVDEDRIGRLVHALTAIDGLPARLERETGAPRVPADRLPRLFSLLKLGFLPEWQAPLAVRLGPDADIPRRRPELTPLNLLRADRVEEALALVARRLRAESLTPLPGIPSHPDPPRLAAALALPITKSLARALCDLALVRTEPEPRD